MEKKYWKGVEELSNDPEFVKHAHKEFPDYLPVREQGEGVEGMLTNRRDFLKLMGFSVAAVSLAACEAPVKKAIPWLNKPLNLDPSVPNYYASTFADGGDYCSILVKTREGRPIKVEGNNLSSVTMGGTSPRAQASVLSLYDTECYRQPMIGGQEAEWETVDKEIKAKLAQAGSKPIYLVSPTIISPSVLQAIADFKKKYPRAEHVMYDPNSASGLLAANEQSFGVRAVPSYDFSKAQTIVSFGADFLGTWISPVQYARQFAKGRKLQAKNSDMSRLYAFETTLSLTGANADYRRPIRPSEEGLYVAALYNAIAKKTGQPTARVTAPKDVAIVEQAAADLLGSRGKSLVVSGSNDADVQLLVNAINAALGNYGETLDLSVPSYQRKGDDIAMARFVEAVKGNRAGAVIFMGGNPVYNHPQGAELAAALPQVSLTVNLATRPDETAALCQYICPGRHYLESWSDAEPVKGFFSLTQPTITPIRNSRQDIETLLTWADASTRDPYQYVQAQWRRTVYAQQNKHSSFRDFWNYSLHDGVFEASVPTTRYANSSKEGLDQIQDIKVASIPSAGQQPAFGGNVSGTATRLAQNYQANGEGIELKIYEKIGLGTGTEAHNPWLQEMPDPISKACWDNYVTMPMAMANEMDIEQGDVVTVAVEGKPTLTLPVLIQPGQARGTIGVALGYGREASGKVADGVGANAMLLATAGRNGMQYHAANVTITPTGDAHAIAQTQTHNTIMARPIVQEAKLAEYKENQAAGRHFVKITSATGEKLDPTDISLWNRHEYPNHAWGMMIDLNSCIGCSACTISCQAENNVPVVGREEVLNRREMHWIRIDRYYSSDADHDDLEGLETAAENPEVAFQPLMCQHCNNAPCETVCPVLATTHSSEGLNQMTYNRCIGTRYCANNCPYKVRRFNWFSYPDNEMFANFNPSQSEMGRMVLNPDVTVRARGVMEKCSLCVHRIQEGKLKAKREGRRPIDGEITTACASACPTEAIVFGDMNDEESSISQIIAAEYDKRAFHILEEYNVRPNISYLTKIRNKA